MKKPVQKKKTAPKTVSKPKPKAKPKVAAKKPKESQKKPTARVVSEKGITEVSEDFLPTGDDAIPSGVLPEERQADLEPSEPSEPHVEGE